MTTSDRFHTFLKNSSPPDFFFLSISHLSSIAFSLAHTLLPLSSNNYCEAICQGYLFFIQFLPLCFFRSTADLLSTLCLVTFLSTPSSHVCLLPSLSPLLFLHLCVSEDTVSRCLRFFAPLRFQHMWYQTDLHGCDKANSPRSLPDRLI